MLKNLGASLEDIDKNGEADVDLAGRTFLIRRQFVEDTRAHRFKDAVGRLKMPHLSFTRRWAIRSRSRTPPRSSSRPGIRKASSRWDKADYLLTDPEDAVFAGRMISEWLTRYLAADTPQGAGPIEHLRVRETGEGKVQNAVSISDHRSTTSLLLRLAPAPL